MVNPTSAPNTMFTALKDINHKPWVIANWKMNPINQADCAKLLDDIVKQPLVEDCQIVLAPNFLYLHQAKQALIHTPIKLAAQNLCGENDSHGAFTGEISATQLADFGVEFVILGHSERRQYYQEHHDVLSKKLANALTKGLSVIFCIGETHEQYLAKQTFDVIEKQLQILADFANQIPLPASGDTNFKPKLLIAYEPVWAIGTGLTPSLEEIESVHNYISEQLSILQIYAPILYGGSVNEKNAGDIAKIAVVDGALVGGASLKADSFYQIIHAFAQKYSKIASF